MRKLKRVLCTITAVCTLITCSACKDTKKAGDSNGDVTLTWVMPGPGKQSDSEKVWSQYNEKLKKIKDLENVTVNFDIIPFSDYKQKVMLMQTSGTKADIIGTYTLDYYDYVKDETFVDLTDMMSKDAPDILKEIPDWALKLTQVNNRQFAITNYQQMCSPMWGYTFNKEDSDKYIDYETASKEFLSSDILTKGTLDIFENYLESLKKDGKLHLGMRPGSTWAMKGYEDIENGYVYRFENDKVVVENRLELETLKMLSERFHDWFKKGYIRKDVLSAEINKGVYDINHDQYYEGAGEALTKRADPKREIKIMQPTKNFYLPKSSNAGGNAISKSCTNPDEALKLLNLMYTSKGKDLYRLLVYGIENEHYKMVGKDRIEPIGYIGSQGTSDAPYGLTKWIVGNTANSFETLTDPEGWNDYVFNVWNPSAMESKIAGIYIDTEPISTKISQCNAVVEEYIDQLTSGAMKDWTVTYDEAMKKLKTAGNDEVKVYLQKQIDQYIATQK